MRTITYKTHWPYAGPGSKRKALLSDFVLDIPYLMEMRGIVPPLHVLNQVLQGGGNSGGMGPGTSWRPFSITEPEYGELVEALLSLDIPEAKKAHPYVSFQKVTLDETLHSCVTHSEWLEAVVAKYRV